MVDFEPCGLMVAELRWSTRSTPLLVSLYSSLLGLLRVDLALLLELVRRHRVAVLVAEHRHDVLVVPLHGQQRDGDAGDGERVAHVHDAADQLEALEAALLLLVPLGDLIGSSAGRGRCASGSSPAAGAALSFPARRILVDGVERARRTCGAHGGVGIRYE